MDVKGGSVNLKQINVVEFASFKKSVRSNQEAPQDARLLIAVDGTIATVDEVFSKYFGYSQTDLEGRPFEQVVLPSSRLTAKIAFEKKPKNFIVRVRCLDGRKVSCILSSAEYRKGDTRFRVLRIQPSLPKVKARVIKLPHVAI
jgi:PAS domain S-box-containing protein